MRPRDMTDKQFNDALARNGLKAVGFLGYVEYVYGRHNCSFSLPNCGSTNKRRMLAYAIKQRDKLLTIWQAEDRAMELRPGV